MRTRMLATALVLVVLLTAGGAGILPARAMPEAEIHTVYDSAEAGKIIYVDADALGDNLGTSWADAYTDLQEALGAAVASDQIWVAEGIYRPASDNTTRTIAFELKTGVSLYGGFAGTETLLSQRDWQSHRSVLSGDIGTTGVMTDNSYNVIRGNDTDGTAILDGFVVTGGYANGSGTYDKGGGLHISNGSPTIANTTFINNYAANHGGAMVVQYTSAPLVVNCTFSGNSTDWNAGGLANLWYGHTTVVNSTFSNNTGSNGGGIVNLEYGNATVRNTILWGNQYPQIGLQSNATISVQYSLIEGGWTDTGNISDDPLFVDPDGADDTIGTMDDDLRLQDTSPAIDAADNASVPVDVTDMDGDGDTAELAPFDQDGNKRFADMPTMPDTGNGTAPIVDMGAFEKSVFYANYLPLVMSSF